MTEEFEERFIRPIVYASYPGTLAALNLTALQVVSTTAVAYWATKVLLSFGSIVFLLSAFSVFFYAIYPTKERLWTATAISFLLGLASSLVAVVVILLV